MKHQLLSNGYILENRYLIDCSIGKGGTSEVFKAFDLNAGHAVRAVKEIHGDNIQEKELESILMAELYKNNTHSNFIPNIIHRFRTNDTLFIVMDYIDGTDMSELLHNGPLPYKKLVEYAKDICLFISFMHDNEKIYSDMKPDNIMIINNNENINVLDKAQKYSSLKFVDFGATIKNGESTIAFTPEYAAPEQFTGQFNRSIFPDKRTDIFNIGATLYHMATGRLPLSVFSSDGTSEHNLRNSYERFLFTDKDKGINKNLKKIISRCVNDDARFRYQSCGDLYKDLIRLTSHKQIKLAALLAAGSLIFLSLGIFASFRCKKLSSNEYENYIDAARNATALDEKINNYKKAIGLEPGDQTAYLGYIKACKYDDNDSDKTNDEYFSQEEKDYLDKAISQHKAVMIENGIYETVEFETGILCWYYLEYGLENNTSNDITRMKTASAYFDKARSGTTLTDENYQMAQTYFGIGDFYQSISSLVREGKDNDEIYKNFWSSINSMLEFIDTSNADNDLILMETYNTAMNALRSYSGKFAAKSTGITYEDQMSLFNNIKSRVDSAIIDISTSDAKYRNAYDLKQKITEIYDDTETQINISYGKDLKNTGAEKKSGVKK